MANESETSSFTLDRALAADAAFEAESRERLRGREPAALVHLLERLPTLRTSALVGYAANPAVLASVLDYERGTTAIEEARASIAVALAAIYVEIDRRIPIPTVAL